MWLVTSEGGNPRPLDQETHMQIWSFKLKFDSRVPMSSSLWSLNLCFLICKIECGTGFWCSLMCSSLGLSFFILPALEAEEDAIQQCLAMQDIQGNSTIIPRPLLTFFIHQNPSHFLKCDALSATVQGFLGKSAINISPWKVLTLFPPRKNFRAWLNPATLMWELLFGRAGGGRWGVHVLG